MAYTGEKNSAPAPAPVQTAKTGRALVVLGGGVSKKGAIPAWIKSRVDTTARVWGAGRYDTVIACGKGRATYAKTEADALETHLVRKGVPAGSILKEPLSTSTIENAYFTRVLHTDPLGIRDLTVVTNAFHIARAETIFNHVLGPDYTVFPVAADDSGIRAQDLALLHEADMEQALFLEDEILGAMEPGDLRAFHSFIYDPNDPLAQEWARYKATSPTYAAVSRIMTSQVVQA